jgi:hypothetical protein
VGRVFEARQFANAEKARVEDSTHLVQYLKMERPGVGLETAQTTNRQAGKLDPWPSLLGGSTQDELTSTDEDRSHYH